MSFEKGECDAGDPDQTNRLPSRQPQGATYIIESIGEPKRWWHRLRGWIPKRDIATVFDEQERESFVLPYDACWVRSATNGESGRAEAAVGGMGQCEDLGLYLRPRTRKPDLGLGKLTINDLAALRRIVIDVVATGDTTDQTRGGWDLRSVKDGERLWSAVCQRIMAEAAPMVEGPR